MPSKLHVVGFCMPGIDTMAKKHRLHDTLARKIRKQYPMGFLVPALQTAVIDSVVLDVVRGRDEPTPVNEIEQLVNDLYLTFGLT